MHYFDSNNFISPIRGSVSMTHTMWANLAAGKLYVSLATASFSNGTRSAWLFVAYLVVPPGLLRGQIGCDTATKGTCSYPPPSVPAVDFCNPIGTSPVNSTD